MKSVSGLAQLIIEQSIEITQLREALEYVTRKISPWVSTDEMREHNAETRKRFGLDEKATK